MNCSIHKERRAVNRCSVCGAYICERCNDVFESPDKSKHFCSRCYKLELIKSDVEFEAAKKKVGRELLRMFIGYVFGLVFIFAVIYGGEPTVTPIRILGFLINIYILLRLIIIGPLFIFIIIWLPFLFASFKTLFKIFKSRYAKVNWDSDYFIIELVHAALIIATIPLYIVAAPFVTVYRVVKRISYIQRLRRLLNDIYPTIAYIDDHIKRATDSSFA